LCYATLSSAREPADVQACCAAGLCCGSLLFKPMSALPTENVKHHHQVLRSWSSFNEAGKEIRNDFELLQPPHHHAQQPRDRHNPELHSNTGDDCPRRPRQEHWVMAQCSTCLCQIGGQTSSCRSLDVALGHICTNEPHDHRYRNRHPKTTQSAVLFVPAALHSQQLKAITPPTKNSSRSASCSMNMSPSKLVGHEVGHIDLLRHYGPIDRSHRAER
jgi:hypothetical protein